MMDNVRRRSTLKGVGSQGTGKRAREEDGSRESSQEDRANHVFADEDRKFCVSLDCKYNFAEGSERVGPHMHQTRSCERHSFCPIERVIEIVDDENMVPIPVPYCPSVIQFVDKDGLIVAQPFNFDKAEVKFTLEEKTQYLKKYREEAKIAMKGKKIAIDQYACDWWLGKSIDLDIDNIPNVNTQKWPKTLYEDLKRKYGSKRTSNAPEQGTATFITKSKCLGKRFDPTMPMNVFEEQREDKGVEAKDDQVSQEKMNNLKRRLNKEADGKIIPRDPSYRWRVPTQPIFQKVKTLSSIALEKIAAEEALDKEREQLKRTMVSGDHPVEIQAGLSTLNMGISKKTLAKTAAARSPAALKQNELSSTQKKARSRSGSASSGGSGPYKVQSMFKSPFLRGFLKDSEIESCVDKMNMADAFSKEMKEKRLREMAGGARHRRAATAAVSGANQLIAEEDNEETSRAAGTQRSRGNARFINVKKKRVTDSANANSSTRYSTAGQYQAAPKALSTYQKLQLLRKGRKPVNMANEEPVKSTRDSPTKSGKEKPIHKFMKRVARDLPQDHYVKIQNLKVEAGGKVAMKANRPEPIFAFLPETAASVRSSFQAPMQGQLRRGTTAILVDDARSPSTALATFGGNVIFTNESYMRQYTTEGDERTPRLPAKYPMPQTKVRGLGNFSPPSISSNVGVPLHTPGSPISAYEENMKIKMAPPGTCARMTHTEFANLVHGGDCLRSPSVKMKRDVLVKQLRKFSTQLRINKQQEILRRQKTTQVAHRPSIKQQVAAMTAKIAATINMDSTIKSEYFSHETTAVGLGDATVAEPLASDLSRSLVNDTTIHNGSMDVDQGPYKQLQDIALGQAPRGQHGLYKKMRSASDYVNKQRRPHIKMNTAEVARQSALGATDDGDVFMPNDKKQLKNILNRIHLGTEASSPTKAYANYSMINGKVKASRNKLFGPRSQQPCTRNYQRRQQVRDVLNQRSFMDIAGVRSPTTESGMVALCGQADVTDIRSQLANTEHVIYENLAQALPNSNDQPRMSQTSNQSHVFKSGNVNFVTRNALPGSKTTQPAETSQSSPKRSNANSRSRGSNRLPGKAASQPELDSELCQKKVNASGQAASETSKKRGAASRSARDSAKKPRHFVVTAEDIEAELPEPPLSELDPSNLEINVILDLMMPNYQKLKENGNIFERADYWLRRGYEVQTGNVHMGAFKTTEPAQFGGRKKKTGNSKFVQPPKTVDTTDQALDFYFQGLRKDFNHFACAFNVGVTFMQKGMNANACKWYRLARLIDAEREEPYLGEAISALKLNKVKHAIKVLRSRPGMPAYERKKKLLTADTEQSCDMLIDSEELEEDDENERRIIESDDEPDFSLTIDGAQASAVKPSTSRDDRGKKSQDSMPIQEDAAAGNGDDTEANTTPKNKLDLENQFQFLQAICYKRGANFEKSQREYKNLEKCFQKRQGNVIARYVFTNLMLPMQEDRKVVEDCVISLVDSVGIADKEAYWNEQDYKRFKRTFHHTRNTWTDLDGAQTYLRELPLFRRMARQGYSAAQFKSLLQHAEVVDKKRGNIIFNQDQYVHIVLNGRVVLRYHEEDPLAYQQIGQYTPGHVIGHPTLDNGVSLMGQVFPIIVSCRCVLLKVKRQFFDDEIWPRTKEQRLEVKIRYLQQFNFISELCDQTLYDIMYERKKILRFKPGATVLACHPRSPLSPLGWKLYGETYGKEIADEVNKVTEQRADPHNQEKALKLSPLGTFFNMLSRLNQKEQGQKLTTRESSATIQNDKFLPERDAPGSPPSTFCRSLCFLLEGSCDVLVDEGNGKKHQSFELRSGDHFGASDLLQIPDIDFMGDIVAGKRGAQVLVVERPDQVIQLYERKNLQEKLRATYDTLKIVLENKYWCRSFIFENY